MTRISFNQNHGLEPVHVDMADHIAEMLDAVNRQSVRAEGAFRLMFVNQRLEKIYEGRMKA